MRSRARWQQVYWVVALGFSASQKTLADFSRACWQPSRASCQRPMSNGMCLPDGRSQSNALLAASSQAWAIRCTNALIPGPPCSSNLPTGRACGDRTCACSRPLDVFTLRCLAARSRSTAPEWQVTRLPTSGYHLSYCAAWPCSRVWRGCSVISLKSCVAQSHPISLFTTSFVRATSVVSLLRRSGFSPIAARMRYHSTHPVAALEVLSLSLFRTPKPCSSLRHQLRLACHAQGGPGNSLQPFFGDGLPAIATDPIRPILDACQRLLYFEEQRFLIVQKSLFHVCFLEIHRLFFRLNNAIAGLD